MRQWTGSASVQSMACRLYGAKPLPERILAYCQFDSWEQISVEFKSEFYHFHLRHLKMSSAKTASIFPGVDELNLIIVAASQRWKHLSNRTWCKGGNVLFCKLKNVSEGEFTEIYLPPLLLRIMQVFSLMMASSHETFTMLLALCEGNPPVNRDTDHLRHHSVHYDVTVMLHHGMMIIMHVSQHIETKWFKFH